VSTFVIGTPIDVRGFSLAGVQGYVCESRDEVDRCVDEILRADAEAVLIVSPSAFELVADRFTRWRREGSGPVFEVLPR
jgi:vacuolar-type H+-ATPase subunit F/Vma7